MAKSPSTKAGKFVEKEIHHIREGKHGARSTKQAIAIGLSKARRKGVKLPVPKKGRASAATRRKARQDLSRARRHTRASPRRKSAMRRVLRRESRSAASHRALSRQARRAGRARARRG